MMTIPMAKAKFYVGTSGYSYPEWKGAFYPSDLASKKMLAYYAEHFGSVEMNGTFRRLPKPEAVKAWTEQVPKDFKFVLKAPQQITHFKRLRDSDDLVAHFVKLASVLKDQLGPLLFQLPPNFKKDAPRLAAFLKLFPKKQQIAFEFRHESWFDVEVFDVLRKHHAVLCNAEADDDLKPPLVSTADWGYLRLRLPEYSKPALKKWVQLAQKQNWRETYVFFKHEDEANGPKFAEQFLKLID